MHTFLNTGKKCSSAWTSAVSKAGCEFLPLKLNSRAGPEVPKQLTRPCAPRKMCNTKSPDQAKEESMGKPRFAGFRQEVFADG